MLSTERGDPESVSLRDHARRNSSTLNAFHRMLSAAVMSVAKRRIRVAYSSGETLLSSIDTKHIRIQEVQRQISFSWLLLAK